MPDRTIIQIDFPPAPNLEDRERRTADFERWYYQLKTAIIRQFEELADKIDSKKDA